MNQTVAIIVGDVFDSASFSSECTSQIMELMEQRDTVFAFSDRYPIIATFFHRRGYRKCELYHPGASPKHSIGKYKLNGGHASYAVIDTILEECDKVIRI